MFLVKDRFSLAECPVWCEASQTLFWTSMADPVGICSYDWVRRRMTFFPTPEPVAAIALTGDHWLLCASRGGLARFHRITGAYQPLSAFRCENGRRCNDGGCDPDGAFVFGVMDDNLAGLPIGESSASIARLGPDGSVMILATGYGVPNTVCFDPHVAGCRLLFADSLSARLYAFDYASQGGLGPATVLHEGPPGVPDGSALDAQGTLWNARWGVGCVLALSPSGGIANRIAVPSINVTSVCFAGPDLTTKVITSALWDVTANQLAAFPQSGRVLAIEGDERGRPSQHFGGRIGEWAVD